MHINNDERTTAPKREAIKFTLLSRTKHQLQTEIFVIRDNLSENDLWKVFVEQFPHSILSNIEKLRLIYPKYAFTEFIRK